MPDPNLQEQFFDQLLTRFPRRADAVEEISQLLHLAKDAVYRRMRSDTFLSPTELGILARHYHISLDALMLGQTNNVLLEFNAFSHKLNDFTDYLSGFSADLEPLRRMPNVHMLYASVEIPVLTYNFFPELIAFKLYTWGRTTWNFEYLRDRPFDFDLLTAPVVRLSETLVDQYIAIASSELWSAQIMDNTLAQIEYHLDAGGFRRPEDALTLCHKLREWAAHMKAMATAGKKFRVGETAELGRGSFQLYHNEMVYANITGLITSDYGQMVYAAFCNPNFLKSADPRLCAFTAEWFKTLMAKSIPISTTAEKNRAWFFGELNKKIDRSEQRIQLFIEHNS
ncbi:MAG: hypothetical protein ABIO24_00665 [Saprospiraceae bacterium]